MLHLVTPYGREGPSSRVRVYAWIDRIVEPVVVSGYIAHRNARPTYLARHPHAVLVAERRLRQMASARPQRLLLHREASPLSRGSLERRLLKSAELAVYDFDDALQWDYGQGGVIRRLAPKAPKARAAVMGADRVIAGNPVLAEWASGHCRDVVLIPSCVEPDSYRAKNDYRLHDPPRLGWIGSPDNERHLLLIAPALRDIHRRVGARLTLIGTGSPSLGELEPLIDRVPWSEMAQHERLADVDIGLAPLPDDLYSRGKSGYKLLQFAAAGVPLIGSPIGVNRHMLAQFGTASPENTDDWIDAIVDLLSQSDQSRAQLGQRARATVQLNYSYSAWLSRWRRALEFHGSAPSERYADADAAGGSMTA